MRKHMRWLMLCITLLFFINHGVYSQETNQEETYVQFRTNKGSFTIVLYNDTPHHKARMLKHVANGDYNGLLFHRVIRNFMTQVGGAVHKGTNTQSEILEAHSSETIEPEILYPKYYHKRGAVAAARLGDEENPDRRSDGIQFYVSVGQFYLEKELSPSPIDSIPTITNEIKKAYMTQGGIPHLDGKYTVFGEVVEGMHTIMRIQEAKTGADDRPLKPIYIKSAKIINRP